MPTQLVSAENAHQKRNKPSVLKSIVSSKSHKRFLSDGAVLSEAKTPANRYDLQGNLRPTSITSSEAQLTGHNVLGEISQSRRDNVMSPKKSAREKDPRGGLGSAAQLSSVSLHSLVKEKKENRREQSAEEENLQSKAPPRGPKKTKSSTSLSGLLAKAKASKNKVESKEEKRNAQKDKENTTPPNSAAGPSQTPIWAQFATQPYREVSTTTKLALNDVTSVEKEISRYTPQDYSPSKQRNFAGYQRPSLATNGASKPRPKSFQPDGSGSLFYPTERYDRTTSNERVGRPKLEQTRRSQYEPVPMQSMARQEGQNSDVNQQSGQPTTKKGGRVMAAVAAFNGKANSAQAETRLDQKSLDAEFESVLESRNVPEDMRQKMRSLNYTIKADFIRKNKIETPQSARPTSAGFTLWSDTTPSTSATASRDGNPVHVPSEESNAASPTKRSRPRSKTFTFSKGDSPSKKQRSEVDTSSQRASSKSVDLTKSPSSRSLSSLGDGAATLLGKKPKPTVPDDFVTYLRTVQKPQTVEVGKLHKLRLLLRNETVAWVDTFIGLGGMTEIVDLLHRIMKVEWREEHEDQLLHEALLCLKGLCTTDIALQKLCEVGPTLFPALLAMLFDEERKGPSEFTTRGLIINILFAHLSSAVKDETTLPVRARTILKYLTDPQPAEEARPIPFILQMHRPRPYRVWCREVTNVTKEVFWIFLHHLNVINFPGESSDAGNDTKSDSSLNTSSGGDNESASSRPRTRSSTLSSDDPHTYLKTHFPTSRPPVPAAPYVGGVEWDATNYLAAHLDLMNGLLASLPTRSERNELRSSLRDSGFERVMGISLRTCKEKLYGGVHAGLRTWIGAAAADGWDVQDVRMGPPTEEVLKRVNNSPKKAAQPAPRLELKAEKGDLGLGLSLDINVGQGEPAKHRECEGGWL